MFEISKDKRICEENNNEIFDNKLNQNASFLLFEDNLLLISFGTQIYFYDLNHLTKPSLIGIYKLKQWNWIYKHGMCCVEKRHIKQKYFHLFTQEENTSGSGGYAI